MNVSLPRFPLFDSLRAIAALSVFAVHLPYVFALAPDSKLWPYVVELNIGVAVFFLISGFLLYRPFAYARYSGETAPAVGPYAERRALRIVPAYWVALPFVVLLVGASGEAGTATEVFSLRGVFSYFGFLQVYDPDTLLGGISAAWTLCVEVTFYAMLPLWALLMRRIPARSTSHFVRTEFLGLAVLFTIGATWTAVAAINTESTTIAFIDPTKIDLWLYVLPGFLDQFAAGMALAVLSVALADRRRQPTAVQMIDRSPWLPWLVAAITFIVIAHLTRWFPGDWALKLIATHELQALFAFALLLPAVFGDPEHGWVRKLLANRLLLWVGLVSYGLYLYHAAILVKLTDWGALDTFGFGGYIAIGLALSLLAAAFSFYCVERPALRLGRRRSHRRRSQDADMRMRDLATHERPEPGVP